MRAWEQKNGKRLLDYFDEHYYPVSNDGVGGLANSGVGDAAMQSLRLQSTRSLWDPSYVEQNWIGKYSGAIRLIPRFHEWVDKNYPGTKTAITEYNFGGLEALNGAHSRRRMRWEFSAGSGLTWQRCGVRPNPNQPGAFAFRMYRNYDGKGGRFGETWVQSKSGDQSKLAIYSAERKQDKALTLVVINKTGEDLTSKLVVSGFSPSGSAQMFRYSAANLNAILPLPAQKTNGGGFNATYPPNSITVIVLPRAI